MTATPPPPPASTPVPPKYRVLVGIEVHLQLRTRSKMFCRCPVRFGSPPNTLTCPVCLGMPGALPVPNRDAMLMALALATAMQCELAELTKFDRKNYFYPDLPKGYQISQLDRPLGSGGVIEIITEDGVRPIRLQRLHIEEDTGKSLHEDAGNVSRVDLNRAGTPLVEVVSEPDITSAAEARAYLTALRALVRYLDISDGNMQEGNLRCEPNINLHIEGPGGTTIKTPIVEVKNVNSVRNVGRAVTLEVERQLAEYAALGPAVADGHRSTRGYDDTHDRTFLMRRKEDAHDYRYFPEPDIPPITIGSAWLREAAERVPELPHARRARFVEEYGLSDYDADQVCRERPTADFFEQAVKAGAGAKPAANWMDELNRHANERGAPLDQLGVGPERFAALVKMVEAGKIAHKAAAREVLPRMMETGEEPEQIVDELGLGQIDDSALLWSAAQDAIDQNPKAAADFRAGKEQALGALMGLVMRETGGKANPKVVRRVLVEILTESDPEN